MIVKSESWGNIPLLHVHNEETSTDAPIVIFLHGFESAKEHNLHYAYQLVHQGCRVLLPDAHLHGTRDENLDQVEMSLRFWEVILTSIEEVGQLKEQLIEKGYLRDQKIALAGTSMGAIISLGCLTTYPWINVAAMMMGTAGYVELAKAQIAQFEQKGFEIPLNDEERENMYNTLATFDATEHIDKLAGKPLFFWHGKKDQVVPFEPTALFVEMLKKEYGEKNISFMPNKTAGHAVNRNGLLAATKWLADHLA